MILLSLGRIMTIKAMYLFGLWIISLCQYVFWTSEEENLNKIITLSICLIKSMPRCF